MKDKKNFLRKAGNDKLRALMVVPIALAVAFMLVVGPTLGQQQNAAVLKNNGIIETTPCPCERQRGTEGQTLSYDDIPTYTPDSIITDPVTGFNYTISDLWDIARPFIVEQVNALAAGCPGISTNGYTNEITPSNGILFSSLPLVTPQKKTMPQTSAGLTVEMVNARIALIDAWMDGYTGEPPGTTGLIPGTWHLGPAMMACGFTFFRLFTLPISVAAVFSFTLMGGICNLGIALAISLEFGMSYTAEIAQAYVHCIEFLSGGG